MILEIIKSNGGKLAKCKCDRCGKEFTRSYSLLNSKNHFCSKVCSGNGRPEPAPNVCMICGKPKDDTFYDKSDRLLCSKACYSAWWDKWYKANITWQRNCMPRNMGNDVSKDYYEYPKRGKLIINYIGV